VTGTGFGRQVAQASRLLFATPGTTGIAAAIEAWTPTSITARVPALAALSPRGFKEVVVSTAWGASAPLSFELGELPVIQSVEPPGASPGAEVEINGRAFEARPPGQLEIFARYEGDETIPTDEVRLPMEVKSWSDHRIEAVVPSLGALRTAGPKQLLITTRWGTGEPGQLVVGDRGSITAHTRLEVHARADDLDAGLATGLQAAVYDAAWMLGRQWQMRELDGEDAGSPIAVHAEGETAAVARWRPGGDGGAAAGVPAGRVPLETLVEHERLIPPRDGASTFDDRRLAAESGLHWLRVLARRLPRETDAAEYRRRYLQWRPMPPPTAEQRAALDDATLRFLDLAAGRVPDGALLYAELQQALPENGGRIPDKPPIDGNDRPGFLAAVADWFRWWDETFTQGTTGGETWVPARMEYSFELAAETTGGEVVLSAPEYDGRRLDWYSVAVADGSLREEPATPSQPGPRPIERTLVPAPVSYPGMPAPRFWEIEDAAVDFGGVRAGPTDLVRLLFVEFATVFGNDWFTIPLDAIPVGSLCRIGSVTVTDTFGRETDVGPLADAVEGFRMFDPGRPDLLLAADALPSTLESRPLEEVLLLRDELANLAWGVERVVAGPAGRPMNRAEVWQRRAEQLAAGQEPPPPGAPPLAYRLSTTVPDYWIPFVLRVDEDDGARWLARAALRDEQTGDPIGPAGELLGRDEPELRLFDEVVARDGVRLRRTWQYGRAPDGSTHLWRTRRRDTGRGEGSSGLRFDVVERHLDRRQR